MADQSMTEKFSYLDLLMYVMPGAVSVLGCLGGVALVTPDTVKKLQLFGEGGLLASIVFLLVSFVVGNALQVFAHTLPEWMLRLLFWHGHWASELALFAGGRCLSRSSRTSVLASLSSLGLVEAPQLGQLAKVTVNRWWRIWWLTGGKEEKRAGLEIAQALFRRVRSYLAEISAGQRAVTAESYYQFYRGLYTVALLGTIGFFVLSSAAAWKVHLGLPVAATAGARPIAICCLVWAALFAWRARGAGEAFVREVYLALSVSELAKERAAVQAAAGKTSG